MRREKMVLSIGLAILTALFGVSSFAAQATQPGSIRINSKSEAMLPDLSKISFDEAAKAALAAVPGKVLSLQLEDENGYLVYGVEVVGADHQIKDVKVDAGDGKILRTESDQRDKENHEREHSERDHDEKD